MQEREKELKAFNQCADALVALDKKSVLKVFHLLSVHFEVMPPANESAVMKNDDSIRTDTTRRLATIALDTTGNGDKVETTVAVKKTNRPKSSSAKQPTYLSNFDFNPTGKPSLKEFVVRYNPKTNLERNLVFIQFLQTITETPDINVNHVFSCYRHLNEKLPLFPSTLTDTKKLKGWIETSDLNNLSVVRAGWNHLQDLEQKVKAEPTSNG
jgi:hypothetical protein